MSLILAFGLSPLGQTAAYAAGDDGGKIAVAQIAQGDEQPGLETQATAATGDEELMAKYKLRVRDVVYDGKIWAGGDLTAATDRLLLNNFVAVTYDVTVKDDDAGTTTTEAVDALNQADEESVSGYYRTDQFVLTYTDPKGKTVDADHPIKDAGTYTVTLEGRGKVFMGQKVTATFEVKPYDFSDVEYWGEPETFNDDGTVATGDPLRDAEKMPYLGKYQPVHYSADSLPYIGLAKDVNGFYSIVDDETGAITSGHLGSEYDTEESAWKLDEDTAIGQLSQDDFDFNPPTLKEFGNNQMVEIVGKGNFTGTKAVRVSVTKGTFATTDNLRVNGVLNSYSEAETTQIASDAVAALTKTIQETKAATPDTDDSSGDALWTAWVSSTENTYAKWYGDLETDEKTAFDNAVKTAVEEQKDDAVEAAILAAMPFKERIDLSAAKANPTVADPDPAGQGKVFFGDTELARGEDYTVKYYDVDPDANPTAKALESMPTAVGKGYYAKITAKSGVFDLSEGNSVTVSYDITIGSALNEVADIADFGSASFLKASDPVKLGSDYSKTELEGEDLESALASSDSREFLTPESLVKPSGATFKSVAGVDVTSAIGDNYRVWKVEEWTDDDERDFLGESGYKAAYPYSDTPYENKEAVSEYFDALAESNDGATAKLADTYTQAVYLNGVLQDQAEVTYGFSGLPAGDYKLYVVGDKDFGSAESEAVYGKFTVAKADPVVGEAAGQLKVEKGNAYIEDGVLQDQPVITMNTGANPATKRATKTQALKQGSAWAVRTGKADYSVVYKQGGEEVEPSADGVYDAEFTFGGLSFEAKTITVEGALEIGKIDLSKVVDTVEVKADSMYTGTAVEPELVFKKDGETVKLTKGVDYTVSYVGVAGLEATDPVPANVPIETGHYSVYVSGAGKYFSKTPEESDDDTRRKNEYTTEGTGYTIDKLNLEDALKDGFATVQFDDDGTWVENYSAVAGDDFAQPAFRVVTTATKGDDNPTVISPSLYKATYDNSKADNNTKVGTYTLVLDPDADAVLDGVVVADKQGKVKYHIAPKSFADEAVGADIVLTPASGTYTVEGQDLGIAVTAEGKTLAVQYVERDDDDDEASSNPGQYIWEIKAPSGDTLNSLDLGIIGTESAAEQSATAAAAIKDFVKDAGDYTVTISGGATNEYGGKFTKTFTVAPKEIASTDRKLTVKMNQDDNFAAATQGYDGTTKYGIARITYSDEKDAAEADGLDSFVEKGKSGNAYTVEGNTGINADTYTATITFTGNYTGTIEKTWKIAPVNIADMLKSDQYVMLVDDMELFGAATDTYDNSSKTSVSTEDAMGWKGAAAAAGKTKAEEQGFRDYYVAEYNGTEQAPVAKIYKATKGADGYWDAANGDYYDLNPVKGLEYTQLVKDATDATPDGKGAYNAGAALTVVASGGNYTGRYTKYFPILGLAIGGDHVTVSFENDDLTYTGEPVEPKGTLTYTSSNGSKFTLDPAKDYKVTYSGDNVNVGGAAVAKFTGLEPNFVGGTETFVLGEFSVQENKRAEQTITYLGEKAITKKVGDAAFKLAASTNATDGKVEFASSDAKVATVDDSGNVVIVGKGTATITISAAATKLFNAATPVEVKLTVNDAAAAPAAKSANSLKIAKATYKVKGVSKAKKTVAGAKVKVKGQGNVTWKKVKVLKGKKAAKKAIAKKIVVKKKTGKIVLKKGLKKGTYKVTVSAKAAGDATHDASKVVKAVVTLKVKK